MQISTICPVCNDFNENILRCYAPLARLPGHSSIYLSCMDILHYFVEWLQLVFDQQRRENNNGRLDIMEEHEWLTAKST